MYRFMFTITYKSNEPSSQPHFVNVAICFNHRLIRHNLSSLRLLLPSCITFLQALCCSTISPVLNNNSQTVFVALNVYYLPNQAYFCYCQTRCYSYMHACMHVGLCMILWYVFVRRWGNHSVDHWLSSCLHSFSLDLISISKFSNFFWLQIEKRDLLPGEYLSPSSKYVVLDFRNEF